MIELAYQKYLQLPLASNIDYHTNKIYINSWIVITGLSFLPPHPHRHFTLEEFSKKYLDEFEFRKHFPVTSEEYDAWREKEMDSLEAAGIITPRLYNKLHEVCPECKKKNYSTTLVGVIHIWGEDYIDKINQLHCECGWTGTPHDLIPN